MNLTDQILGLISRHPYAVLVLGIFAENAGLPLPGEVLIVLVAATAGTNHSSLPLVVLAAALGAVLGDSFSYWLGRRGGMPLIDRYCKVTLCSRECGNSITSFYRRFGSAAVAVARFVPAVRALAAPVAGMTRMRWTRFLSFDALGALVWATAFGFPGRLIGRPLLRILEDFHAYGRWVLPAVLTAAAGTIIYRLFKRKKYGRATAEELRQGSCCQGNISKAANEVQSELATVSR